MAPRIFISFPDVDNVFTVDAAATASSGYPYDMDPFSHARMHGEYQ